MKILDRENAFIGHEREVDEGYETTMRRNAFIAGFKEALGLVKKMREAQKKIKGYSPTRIEKDRCQWENDLDNKAYLESEVDELIKEL